MKVLFVISAAFCACSAQYIPPNPCPDYFMYLQDNGRIFGKVQFENDLSGDYTLYVNMSVRAYLTNNENIKLESRTPPEEIKGGNPLAFYIHFPIQNVIPRPTEIKFNGRIYCSGPPEEVTRAGVTNMWSAFSLKYDGPIIPGNRPQQQYPTFSNLPRGPEGPFQPQFTTSTTPPSIWYFNEPASPDLSPWTQNIFTSPPIQTTTRSTPSPTTTTRATTPHTSPTIRTKAPSTTQSTTPSYLDNDDECGVPFVQTLIVGGDTIEEGQYPWMVAIIYSKQSAYTYGCTGSLVSKKHVVSAGHCMFNRKGPLVPFTDIVLVLGRVNIENWARGGATTRGVENAQAHPDYKPNRGDADIAVIIMDQPVPFGDYIRPICLWEGADDLNNIVGDNGTIAGWGMDESGKKFVTQAKKISIPVVSQEECVNSNRGFKRLTTDRTFCAGSKDGTGPCRGDSGAGFGMIKHGKWLLRGVVSSSLENGSPCNLEDYIIFADAAKFAAWLQSFIL